MTPALTIPEPDLRPGEVIIGSDLLTIGLAMVGDRVYVDGYQGGKQYGVLTDQIKDREGQRYVKVKWENAPYYGRSEWVPTARLRKERQR